MDPRIVRNKITGPMLLLIRGPLAVVDNAIYLVLADRIMVSVPHSVALMQLRFTSLCPISSREGLHLQECTHPGHTQKKSAGENLRILLNNCQLANLELVIVGRA
jgi:hypothetical protein